MPSLSFRSCSFFHQETVMFYSIIDCRGKVSFRVTRIPLWEDWWICRHVAHVVTIPGTVSPAVSYPDLLSGCCVRSECGHNRTVSQFIFPSLWRTRFHRFHLPISIFPIARDTIRNFFRTTNHVSLPPIFDRSLFNLYHKLKKINSLSLRRNLHDSTVTRRTMNFYSPLLIECPSVRSFDRSAFRLSRIVKCQSLYQRERNRPSPPPTFAPPSSGIETVRQIFPSPANQLSPGSCTRRNFATRFKCLECAFGAATIPAGVAAPPCTCNFPFTGIAN